MQYDIIGDIHGHAGALKALLQDLGYRDAAGAWRKPGHQAIFVGDFIDRGPNQVETVNIVRRMVDENTALAVMGNHELNAIAWFLPDEKNPGDFLRPHFSSEHGKKNFDQHKAFLAEVEGKPAHGEFIDWFLTLPLWLELPSLRVVHACWHQPFMDELKPKLAMGNRLTRELIPDAVLEPKDINEKDSPTFSLFKAVEALTKGMEAPLPQGHSFKDAGGDLRYRARIRWWDDSNPSIRHAALLDESKRQSLPDDPLPPHFLLGCAAMPTFIGHYWQNGEPKRLGPKIGCVDYSIAKGGKLVAYRWDGEAEIDDENFHWIGKLPGVPLT